MLTPLVARETDFSQHPKRPSVEQGKFYLRIKLATIFACESSTVWDPLGTHMASLKRAFSFREKSFLILGYSDVFFRRSA